MKPNCWKCVSHRRPIDRNRRRGFLYLAVLLVALMVALCSMSAISIMQSQQRSVTDGVASLRAQTLADSAIAFGLAQINDNPAWRTSFTHGVNSTPVSLNSGTASGTISFRLDDPDGNLTNDTLQGLKLIGIGRCGAAAAACSVQLEPAGEGLPVLNYSVSVGSTLSSSTSVHWIQDAGIYARGNVSISNPPCFLSDRILANGWISYEWGIYWNNTYGISQFQPALQFPGASWPEYYDRVGTMISIDDIPTQGGIHRMENIVLFPGNNPYGEANGLGVYVIDCEGENLQISNARLAATLLIKNPGANSIINGAIHWQPAVDDFPALLVQGNITIAHGNLPLQEATVQQNLNPTGCPYRGSEDNDTNDVYPSKIDGLIYVNGTLALGSQTVARTEIDGCVVCQTLNPTGNAKIIHSPEISQNPPPGFRSDSKMRIVSGSYRRQSL